MNRFSRGCIRMLGAILVGSLAPPLMALAGIGDLDPSYGTGGIHGVRDATWPGAGSYSRITGPIVLADGRLIVLRMDSGGLYSRRVDLDGLTDAGFGNSGTERIPMYWGVSAVASSRQGSSFIASGSDLPAVARLRPDGTLDAAFGVGGVASIRVGLGHAELESIAALEDGGAVALWVQYGRGDACATDVRLIRLDPAGQVVAEVPVATSLFNFVDCTGWLGGYETGNAASMRSLAGDLIQLTLPHAVLFYWAGQAPLVQTLTAVNPPATLPAYGVQGADETGNYVILVAPSAGLQARLLRLRSDLVADSGFGTEAGGGVQIDFSRVPGVASTWMIDGFATSILAMDPQFIYLSVQLKEMPGFYPRAGVIVRLFKDGRVDASFGTGGFAHIRGGTYTSDPYGAGGGGGRVIGVQAGGRALVQMGGAVLRTFGNSAGSAGMIDLRLASVRVSPRGYYPYPEWVGVAEGESATVEVVRGLGSTGAVSVSYRLTSTTATAGVDHAAVSGTLTWADGETGVRSFIVPVAADAQVEQGEGFDVIIESSGPAVLLNSMAHYAIVDSSTGGAAPPVTTPPVVTPPVATPPVVLPPVAPPQTPDSGSPAGDFGGGGSMDGLLLGLLGVLLLARARRQCAIARFGAVLLCGLAPCLSALAGVGDIDPSYGTAGRYALSLPQYWQSGSHTHVLADGRVTTIMVDAEQLHVVRADINGRPDPGFGVGGERTTPVPGMRDGYWAALGPDGSVFMAMETLTGAGHRLLRLTPDGNIDASFGQSGMISLDAAFDRPGIPQHIESITPLRDGGAVLMIADFPGGAYGCGDRLRLFRLRQDGLLSAAMTLGSGHFNYGNCYDWGAAGLFRELSGSRLQVALYDTNLLFDISGSVGPPMEPASWPSGFNPAVIIAANERYTYVSEGSAPAGTARVVRLRSDFTIDAGFGTSGNGGVTVDFRPVLNDAGSGWVYWGSTLLVPAPDAPFVYVVADIEKQSDNQYRHITAIARLFADGRIDTAFGSQGLLTIWGYATVAGEQPDGRGLLQIGQSLVRMKGTDSAASGAIWLDLEGYLPGSWSTVSEGSLITMRASRSLGSNGAVSVRYRVVPQALASASDIDTVAGELRWEGGETGVKTFDLRVVADNEAEPAERFRVILESPQGGGVLLDDTREFSILAGSATPPVTTPPGTTPPVPTPPVTTPPVMTPPVPTPPVSNGGGSPSYSGGGGSMDGVLLTILGSLLVFGARLRLKRRGSTSDCLVMQATVPGSTGQ